MEVDNFALDCYRRCPQYYRRRIHEGLVKATDSTSTAPTFGAAIHRALEVYYKEGMTSPVASAAIEIFEREFTPHESLADDKRTVGKGRYILEKYFERYCEEPFEVIETEIGAAVELDEGHTYCGRLDLLVQWKNPSGVYIIDHKTTSMLDGLCVKPNNQLTGYVYACQEMYENVHGAMLNLIGVYKTDKQRDKNTGKMVDRDVFKRLVTTRLPHEIDEWKRNILHTIHQIQESIIVGRWPMYDSCRKFNTNCQYLDLCNADEYTAQRLVEMGFYIKDEWKAYETGDLD